MNKTEQEEQVRKDPQIIRRLQMQELLQASGSNIIETVRKTPADEVIRGYITISRICRW